MSCTSRILVQIEYSYSVCLLSLYLAELGGGGGAGLRDDLYYIVGKYPISLPST